MDDPAARPLVLLDVDGVLNAVGAVPGLRQGRATAGGRSWPIRWSPEVVQGVLRWRASAEVAWLTTWGHDANDELRALLGLPELPVAGTWESAGTDGAPSLLGPAGTRAAVTPAAPDALTGRWWKFDVVRDLLRRQPGRRLVWVDDDLAGRDPVREWVQEATACLLVAPDPHTGLTPAQVADVERFLAG